MNRSIENAPASYGLLRKLSKVAGGLDVSRINITHKRASNLLQDATVMSIESDLRALGAFGVAKPKQEKRTIVRSSTPIMVLDI